MGKPQGAIRTKRNPVVVVLRDLHLWTQVPGLIQLWYSALKLGVTLLESIECEARRYLGSPLRTVG